MREGQFLEHGLPMQAPDRVIINAAGGPEVANGKCVELILSDVLPVVSLSLEPPVFTHIVICMA